jgi:hypothetical protein
LLAVDPPLDVRDAFHDVVRAFEDRERLVQEAEGYAEQVVPAARGQAAQVVLEAEANREQRVIRAEGDASRFLAAGGVPALSRMSCANACTWRVLNKSWQMPICLSWIPAPAGSAILTAHQPTR